MIRNKEISNWLESDLNKFLRIKFLHETPHWFREYSRDPAKIFYSHTFDQDNLIINYLCFKLAKTLNLNLEFKRVYLNIQHPTMDGEYHTDDECEMTCLYMLYGEGDFELKDEKHFEFEDNKLICFDSKKLHKGHAPKNGPRITLAFKTNVLKNEKK